MISVSYGEYFSSLSDNNLNAAIKALIEARCDYKETNDARVERLAIEEWRRRHPGTVAPCVYDRAEVKGGFPSCYTGPTETVDLEDK